MSEVLVPVVQVQVKTDPVSEHGTRLLPGERPWECAKRLDKTIIAPLMGRMVGVYYPFRKAGDLYLAGNDKWHCCQCDTDVQISDLPAHFNDHGKQHKNHKKVK